MRTQDSAKFTDVGPLTLVYWPGSSKKHRVSRVWQEGNDPGRSGFVVRLGAVGYGAMLRNDFLCRHR